MMIRSYAFALLMLAGLFSVESARGYELGPLAVSEQRADFEKKSFGFFGEPIEFERNHEIMTALAILCLAEANAGEDALTNEPGNCGRLYASPGQLAELFNEKLASGAYPAKIQEFRSLVRHVRWPDDPTRFVHDKKRSMLKFAALIKGGCQKRFEEPHDPLTLKFDGLFCTSHFGKLQFLHAMASKDHVPARVTRALIEEWARFAASLYRTPEIAKKPYCDFWDGGENGPGTGAKEFPLLAQRLYEPAFEDERSNWCEWRRGARGRVYPEWKVGTMFVLQCDNPFGSATCDLLVDLELPRASDKRFVQLAALGSLLHLIQDSFSASHTVRGSHGDRYPIAVCGPVEAYRSYSQQDSEKHGESDKSPAYGLGCQSGEDGVTLDPITASARAIWWAANESRESDGIEKLIAATFGEMPDPEAPAEPGDAYRKDCDD